MSPLLKKNSTPLNDKKKLAAFCGISAGLAAVMMIFVYFCQSNTLVGGDRTVLRMDLYHQYGPLFSELYDRVTNGYSLVYSWTSGLGSSFTGNLLNYCASPFAIFMLLGHKNMPEAIALMVMGKAMLSSASFTYYINKTNKHLKPESIAFGLLYAFSGYFVAYSWNIMWLDAMAVFPLVMLGIERIINQNKPWLYLVALTYTMFTNYYMAYMVCILSVLYFLYYYFARYNISEVIEKSRAKVKLSSASLIVSAAIAIIFAAFCGFVFISGENENQTAVLEFCIVFVMALVFSFVINFILARAITLRKGYKKHKLFYSAMNTAPVYAEQSAEETAREYSESVETTAEEVELESDTVLENESENNSSVAENESEITEHVDVLVAPPAEVPTKHYSSFREYLRDQSILLNYRFMRTGMSFALFSILSVCLAAVCLIPVYYCLQTSSATGGTWPTEIKYYFNMFDFIANHFASLEPTIRSSGDDVLPNVYCGMMTLLMLPMYFLNPHIKGRRKVLAVIAIGSFFLCFSINYLNFIWHGLHMPNDLPYRYSFAYSFLLLTLAYQAFIHFPGTSKKTVVGVGIAMMMLVVLVQETGSKNVELTTVNTSIVFVIVYCILLGAMLSSRMKKKVATILLILVTFTELLVSDTVHFVMAQPKDAYVGDYDNYQAIKSETEDEDTELFYRTELSKLRTRMDASWYGYNGVSVFSSMAYEHTAKLMEKLGLFGNNINSYTYYPQTPVFNSMVSIRYVYDTTDNLINSDKIYTELGSNPSFTAYKYNYYLPLGYMVSEKIANWNTTSSNPFDVQNEYVNSATGTVAPVFTNVEVTDFESTNLNTVSAETINNSASFTVSKVTSGSTATGTVVIDVEEDGEYYVYAGSTRLDSIQFSAEGLNYTYVSSAIQPFVMDVGYQKAGSQIRVVYTIPEADNTVTLSFCASKLNEENWEKAYKKLSANTLNLTQFDETTFEGTVSVADDNSVLYTSVPYDESWVITVDGKELSYSYDKDADSSTNLETLGDVVRVGDALFGIKLSKGEHTVRFTYKLRGFSAGLKLCILGIIAIAAILVYCLVIKRKDMLKKFRPSLFEEIREWNI